MFWIHTGARNYKNVCQSKKLVSFSPGENKGKKLSLTWKVYILLCHVEPFVLSHKCDLGRYADQVGESIHAKFKPTWSRYNRSEGHTEHGSKLLSAVKQFGGRRIN